MKKMLLKTQHGDPIPCIYRIPDHPQKVVIVIHGFGSSRESMTGALLLGALPKAGIGAIAYDHPAHGTNGAENTDLRIETCLDYLQTVEDWIRKEYPDAEIGYFGSSFGAYITLLYASRRTFAGTRAFLRSAAVNMPELLLTAPASDTANPASNTADLAGGTIPEPARDAAEGSLCDAETTDVFASTGDSGAPLEFDPVRTAQALPFAKAAPGGYVILNADYPHEVKAPLDFFTDLYRSDLGSCFDPSVPDRLRITMVHGEKDETILPEKAIAFAEKHDIPIRIFRGEDHTLSTFRDTPPQVVSAAVRFFSEE